MLILGEQGRVRSGRKDWMFRRLKVPREDLITRSGDGTLGQRTRELEYHVPVVRRVLGVYKTVKKLIVVCGVELTRSVLVRNKPEIVDGIQA